MKIKIAWLLIIALFITSNNTAQEVNFGKVTKKELEEKFYPNDTSANAVVLYKKRRTYYEYETSGWVVKTEVHERLKLYNKDGFDSATKKVRLFDKAGVDETFNLKAYTYNLKDGKIEKTKLEKSGSFKEKISENWSSSNFTLPNLKDGSIVEWKYTITSPFQTYIDDVICQYNIPIKYLDVKVQIPEFFRFKFQTSRYYPIEVTTSRIDKTYRFTYKSYAQNTARGHIGTPKMESVQEIINENIYSATITNIPALIEEPYVNNINNYRANINFEISAYIPTKGNHKYYNVSWKDVTKTIYENPYFGVQLDKKNHFEDDLANITEGITSQNEKIGIIFQYVKNKIKWNKEYSKYTSNGGVKKAYNDGVGNVADINLTLVAMLKESGLNASPILVSTRSHGIPLFPTSKGYNYVIAGVEIQNDVILLDATEKYSMPNVLPLRVLNWEGRLVRDNGSSTTINLYPNKYNAKQVILSGKIDSEGTLSGLMKSTYNNLNALQYRNGYGSLAEDDLISKIEVENNDIEIDKFRLTNKTDITKPLVEMVKFTRDNQVDIIGDKMYISPLLFLTVSENPFKLEERLYPIDYGSAWKNDVTISIQFPEGYEVESKPEDFSIALPDNLGTYILKTEVVNNKIKVTSQTKINIAIIGANYYKTLKELYKQAIEHQMEKIVLVQG